MTCEALLDQAPAILPKPQPRDLALEITFYRQGWLERVLVS
jgi:hypothetical protein